MGLFLASYIWAVDAARLGGLEDLDKDDTGEDVNPANSYMYPSPSRAFFFFRTCSTFSLVSRSVVDSDVSSSKPRSLR